MPIDDYKVKQIGIMINDLSNDEYANARLKSDNSKAINLDIDALYLLQSYYNTSGSSRNFRVTESRGTDKVKFFYNGKLIGTSRALPIECPEFEDLMYDDKKVATGVLNWMNSFGDPLYPVSDEDPYTPETNIDNVDIHDLYFWFMREIGYQYDDEGEVYIDDIPNVEIFTGDVAE